MTAARGIGRGNGARLRASPRCCACTRRGTACAAPAVRGRTRCRMHGGAAGSGAPRGNRNALKDGYHTAAARTRRRALNAFIRAMTAAVARLEREAGDRAVTGANPLHSPGRQAGGPGRLRGLMRVRTGSPAQGRGREIGEGRGSIPLHPFGYAGHVNPFGYAGHVHPFGCMGLNCGFPDAPSLERDSRLRGNDGDAREWRGRTGMTGARGRTGRWARQGRRERSKARRHPRAGGDLPAGLRGGRRPGPGTGAGMTVCGSARPGQGRYNPVPAGDTHPSFPRP